MVVDIKELNERIQNHNNSMATYIDEDDMANIPQNRYQVKNDIDATNPHFNTQNTNTEIARYIEPKVDPTTSKWLEKNTWYGPDEEMTALALGTHARLEREFGKGYIGSEEYFKRIDQTMRKRFPENFSEEIETQTGDDKPNSRTESRSLSVVAPATRSTASKRIVLKTSQMAIAKRLGLTPEQYAREVQKLEK